MRKIRDYLSAVPDIEECGVDGFWRDFEGPDPQPCCPFTHAAVARGLVYVKGKGGSIRSAIEFGVPDTVRQVYSEVWDKSVKMGVAKIVAHEKALTAAEIVEDSL
jgi:hypothetical protein